MTVKEIFEKKYREKMATITEREWKYANEDAEFYGMPVAEYIMRNLEITGNECNPRKNADAYWELIALNKSKLIASNMHRQEHGHIDRFWLTKKGYKQLFASERGRTN